MIVGGGLLAMRFSAKYANDEAVVVFASGVSNSAERSALAFERERELLRVALASARGLFVYFSSCGVASASTQTPYMRHKASMESLVLSSPKGLVLRLPQVVGKTPNPHTLTNFLHAKIVSGERFQIWEKAERNLIDIDDVFAIGCEHIDTGLSGLTVSIASEETLPMPRIVEIFERVTGLAAHFDTVDAGEPLVIDNRASSAIAARLDLDLGNGYTESIIRKYYG